MGVNNFAHFMVVAAVDSPVMPFTFQLLRYQSVTGEGVVVGTFVQERPCIDSTESVSCGSHYN